MAGSHEEPHLVPPTDAVGARGLAGAARRKRGPSRGECGVRAVRRNPGRAVLRGHGRAHDGCRWRTSGSRAHSVHRRRLDPERSRRSRALGVAEGPGDIRVVRTGGARDGRRLVALGTSGETWTTHPRHRAIRFRSGSAGRSCRRLDVVHAGVGPTRSGRGRRGSTRVVRRLASTGPACRHGHVRDADRRRSDLVGRLRGCRDVTSRPLPP